VILLIAQFWAHLRCWLHTAVPKRLSSDCSAKLFERKKILFWSEALAVLTREGRTQVLHAQQESHSLTMFFMVWTRVAVTHQKLLHITWRSGLESM